MKNLRFLWKIYMNLIRFELLITKTPVSIEANLVFLKFLLHLKNILSPSEIQVIWLLA
jgi:hypothetical protein